jgi:hypothetical protein
MLMNLDRWKNVHLDVIRRLVDELHLPNELVEPAFALWSNVRTRAPRTPKSLAVDCVYVVAHMTGNRRSFARMKDASFIVINRRCEPLWIDRRSGKKRWHETDWGKIAILSLINDDNSYNDLVNPNAMAR